MLSECFIRLYIPSEVDNLLTGWRKRSFDQLITLEIQFSGTFYLNEGYITGLKM
jgi:hypothetical protein